VNINIDAALQGIEAEYLWAPTDKWLFSANLGLLKSEVKDTFGIDVLDRANGRSDIVVLKNASTFANCAVSARGYQALLAAIATPGSGVAAGTTRGICGFTAAQRTGLEAALGLTGQTISYVGTDGRTQTASLLQAFEGDAKNLDGNQMTGAPEVTLNLAGEYTFDAFAGAGWDLTVRGDVYYQGESQSRIWNTARDQLDAWHNVNLSARLANTETGWSVEAYAKNITDEEVITGAYLTDDSSGLFTNIFLTEPALYGLTVRKTW
jgi:outer membrane receptor protein involved in Fe transport